MRIELKGRYPIKDRGPLYPPVGLLSTASVILSFRILGVQFDPIFVISLLLIGLGSGLVVARIGRLGPFEGHLGSPWFESQLSETLTRETARALRFDRKLSIVAVHSQRGPHIDWTERTRLTDQVVPCRYGWTVLILPETDQPGAIALLRRVRFRANIDFQAALVNPRPNSQEPTQLGDELLKLIQATKQGNDIIVQLQGKLEHLSLTG